MGETEVVQIHRCEVSCPLCRTPLLSSHPSERGIRINKIATLGSELVIWQERRRKSKPQFHKTIDGEIAKLAAELAQLGARLDPAGFIVTEG